MKMNGRKLSGPSTEVVVIPKRDGELVFKAQAVLSYEDFYKLCPKPIPPTIVRPGGIKSQNTEDKDYLKAIEAWAANQTSWMILQSLKATPELEWETVDPVQPNTWDNYQKELKAAGLSDPEINRIVMCVIDANGLNNKKIDEATAAFLASQEKALNP